MERGHTNGHRQQDLQHHHVWTTIQDNQQTRREVPIWIHTWSWMPIWQINDQETSTSNTKPQPSNMGGIIISRQGLQHLQSRTTHFHTRKCGAPPRLQSAIKRMYNKSIVKIIIGKVDTSI